MFYWDYWVFTKWIKNVGLFTGGEHQAHNILPIVSGIQKTFDTDLRESRERALGPIQIIMEKADLERVNNMSKFKKSSKDKYT